MKYSHYIQCVEHDAPDNLKGRFLKYKKLKKAIKRCRARVRCPACSEGGHGGPCICAQIAAEDASFFEELDKQTAAISREFARASKQVLQLSHQGANDDAFGCSWKLSLCPLLARRSGRINVEELVQRAEWCRRYAQINSVGLRKILKKHDKLLQNGAGRQYMQEVWSGSRRTLGTFLHSPLLEELRSLEAILQRQARRQLRAAGGGSGSPRQPPTQVMARGAMRIEMGALNSSCADEGDSSARGGSLPMLPSLEGNAFVARFHERAGSAEALAAPPGDAGAAQGPAAAPEPVCVAALALAANESSLADMLRLGRVSIASSGMASCDEVDADYMCPICMEAMYQPLGLECGHKFCADCAFSCVGKGNALGSVQAILDHVPRDAACPECRTRGVFVSAIQLPETERLIKSRYPASWAERADEAHRKEARLRQILAAQRASDPGRYLLPPVP